MEACLLPTSASLPRALPIPFGHLQLWTVTFRNNNTLHVISPIQRLHGLSGSLIHWSGTAQIFASFLRVMN
ncbi:uncharacterized protein BDW70DRAFT_143658 [Aspergillus foveolatus]|uniref:uncharacterized protein n=1 Tax=Aspergillus foveolatus TaxID=210207 RepID=UPI003CCDCCA8